MSEWREIMTDKHNIPRNEWVKRFGEHIIKQVGTTTPEHDKGMIEAELESWGTGEDDDWFDELPEDAADSNISYWAD